MQVEITELPATLDLHGLQTPYQKPSPRVVFAEVADSSIVRFGDEYIYTQTSFHSIWLWRSTNLFALSRGEKMEIWGDAWMNSFHKLKGSVLPGDVWAPQLHYSEEQKRWYIYCAAKIPDPLGHRMFVLESRGQDPFSGFTIKNKMAVTGEDCWAIDGTVVTNPRTGRPYFVWSGRSTDYFDGSHWDQPQYLYIAEMKSPWELKGNRVQISAPQYSWEGGTNGINEGPENLENPKKLSLGFAAAKCWDNSYALGQIDLEGDDPMRSDSWYKHPEPIMSSTEFSKDEGIFGFGHGGAVVDNNDQRWFLGQFKRNKDHTAEQRCVGAFPYEFNESDGRADFDRRPPHFAPHELNALIGLGPPFTNWKSIYERESIEPNAKNHRRHRSPA